MEVRKYGLNVDAPVIGALEHGREYRLGMGGPEHGRKYGLGMDALAIACSRTWT